MDVSRYRIVQKIAQGGMAEVFCAEQENPFGFRRRVAIKRILPKHLGSAQHEAMLVSEAKLLVGLNHPNIVKVYDLGCLEGAYFFVMEFVDGCDLRRLIQWVHRKGKHFPLTSKLLIAAEVAKALDYAHGKADNDGLPLHLVHLDVSPRNILLSRSGEVKLTDFGIATFRSREAPERTDRIIVRGKYSYMSPEQAFGGLVDNRSDIFSLGLVMYEMIMGSRLYRSAQLTELQREHRDRRVFAPLCPPHVPAEIEYILLRCLAYDAEDRYASAGELAQDLLRFVFEEAGSLPQAELAYLMEEALEEISIVRTQTEADTQTAYQHSNVRVRV